MSAAAKRIAAVAGDDVVGIVLALHRFVHTSLDYTPGATYIGVDVNEVLAEAHGRLPGLRPPGGGAVPQRRHPGPLRVRLLLRRVRGQPAPTRTATRSTVQTHAWFEAAIPGWGWLALDPTNALQVGQRHITIGHGRDYDDVPPVRGVYTGSGSAEHRGQVEIRRQAAVVQQLQAQQQQQSRAARRPVRGIAAGR